MRLGDPERAPSRPAPATEHEPRHFASGAVRVRLRLRLPRPDPILTGAFVMGTVVLLAHTWDRVTRPGLWAEDGTHFLPDSHQYGFMAFFHQFAGYIQIYPRIFALAVTALPLRDVPAGYTLTALLGALIVFSTVLVCRIDWLMPSRVGRGVAFVILCALPDGAEPLANLANLIFICVLATTVIGLSEDPRTRAGRILELISVFVLVLSGAAGLLTFPVYAQRLWRSRTRHSITVVTVFAISAVIQIAVYLDSSRKTANDGTVWDLIRAYLIRLPGQWIVGSAQWGNEYHHGDLSVVGPVFMAVLAVIVILALRSGGLAIILTQLVLLGSVAHAYGPTILKPGLWRHFFTPLGLLVVAIVACADTFIARAHARNRPRLNLALAGVAVVLLLSGTLAVKRDFHLGPNAPRVNMALLQPCLHPLSAACSAPESPLGWRAILHHKT